MGVKARSPPAASAQLADVAGANLWRGLWIVVGRLLIRVRRPLPAARVRCQSRLLLVSWRQTVGTRSAALVRDTEVLRSSTVARKLPAVKSHSNFLDD